MKTLEQLLGFKKMRIKSYPVFFYILLLFGAVIPASLNFTGCGNKKILDEDKFVRIYTELIIAKDTSAAVSSKGNGLLRKVLSRYSVSEKQYKETVDYYNRDPEKWRKFFQKAITYADSLKKKRGI